MGEGEIDNDIINNHYAWMKRLRAERSPDETPDAQLSMVAAALTCAQEIAKLRKEFELRRQFGD